MLACIATAQIIRVFELSKTLKEGLKEATVQREDITHYKK
jgi:hypothetical protein